MTVRNVVVGRLHDLFDPAQSAMLDEALARMLALRPTGLISMHTGRDLRYRDGTWDFAITADFEDEAAYREYDGEAEHNRIRADLFAKICEQIARVQFEVGPPTTLDR